jgi:hypothetical protein
MFNSFRFNFARFNTRLIVAAIGATVLQRTVPLRLKQRNNKLNLTAHKD